MKLHGSKEGSTEAKTSGLRQVGGPGCGRAGLCEAGPARGHQGHWGPTDPCCGGLSWAPGLLPRGQNSSPSVMAMRSPALPKVQSHSVTSVQAVAEGESGPPCPLPRVERCHPAPQVIPGGENVGLNRIHARRGGGGPAWPPCWHSRAALGPFLHCDTDLGGLSWLRGHPLCLCPTVRAWAGLWWTHREAQGSGQAASECRSPVSREVGQERGHRCKATAAGAPGGTDSLASLRPQCGQRWAGVERPWRGRRLLLAPRGTCPS